MKFRENEVLGKCEILVNGVKENVFLSKWKSFLTHSEKFLLRTVTVQASSSSW